MANTQAPFGFRQLKGTGSAPTYEQVTAFAQYNASAMFFGDPVYQNSDGSVYVTTPGVLALAGVFVGCKYLSVAMKRTVWSNYWPGSDVASTNTVECYLINDPNAQWIAQIGGSASTGLAATDIGANVQVAFGTGNTANGISGAYIDISVTPTTTTTLPFKVVALANNPNAAPGGSGQVGAAPTGAYNWGVFAFNNILSRNLTGI